MARGGARPGAGRKPGKMGSKVTASSIKMDMQKDIKDGKLNGPLEPLAYMLKVMNDETVPVERRDRMAQSAAPFVHARAEAKTGKKEEKQSAADKASSGKFAPAKGPNIIPMVKQG